jgi:hypothetical protein
LHKSDRIYTLGNATNIWFGENRRKSSHIITDVIESQVAKLVVLMLVPAALRVRIQTSLKNLKWANMRGLHTVAHQKNILKNYDICFLFTCYLFYVVDISTRQHSEVAVGGGGGGGRRGSVEQACLLILSVIRAASD